MISTSDRIIIHEANEMWSIDTIMKYDFPKLKERGFKYAIVLEGHNGECFVYGHYTRGRSIKHSLQNLGSCTAYDLSTNRQLC